MDEIKLMAIVSNEILSKSDAIICLEGDGQERTKKALKIFNGGLADLIVVSGGFDKLPFSIIAEKMAEYLIKEGVDKKNIIIEGKSKNTREQAEEVIKIAKEKKWKKIILVASAFHQPRAFLTFLKAVKDFNIKLDILNAPAREKNWFLKTSLGISKIELLEEEFEKIKKYAKKGHIISIKEALLYQKGKEGATP